MITLCVIGDDISSSYAEGRSANDNPVLSATTTDFDIVLKADKQDLCSVHGPPRWFEWQIRATHSDGLVTSFSITATSCSHGWGLRIIEMDRNIFVVVQSLDGFYLKAQSGAGCICL